MALLQAVFLLLSVTLAMGQRGSYAGTKPIGFPELQDKPTTEGLGNRFGEDVTTPKLPLEALGDKDLVDRLSKLPEDKQVFWILNAQALEANRQKPQVYPQRPNIFAQPLFPQSENPSSSTSQNGNIGFTGSTSSGISTLGTNTPAPQITTTFARSPTPGNVNSEFTAQTVPENSTGNRN